MKSARLCLENQLYKDSINRSYYVVFYAVKAVLAIEPIDFKRHKDALGYFNKTYVATALFPKDLGKKIGRIKRIREASDYDDFFVASQDDAQEQIQIAEYALELIGKHLTGENIID